MRVLITAIGSSSSSASSRFTSTLVPSGSSIQVASSSSLSSSYLFYLCRKFRSSLARRACPSSEILYRYAPPASCESASLSSGSCAASWSSSIASKSYSALWRARSFLRALSRASTDSVRLLCFGGCITLSLTDSITRPADFIPVSNSFSPDPTPVGPFEDSPRVGSRCWLGRFSCCFRATCLEEEAVGVG